MAIRIHHTQQKQADKLGVVLTRSDMDVTASKGGQAASAPSAGLAIAALLKKLGVTTADTVATPRAANKPKPTKAKRKAKRRATDDDEEGDEAEDDGKSIIKKKYRTAYRPHRMTCGDALSQQIRAEFMTVKDLDTNKKRLDWKRFTAFAKRNDCWSDGYAKLNAGMRRMNVVNRLRARIAAGTEVVWG